MFCFWFLFFCWFFSVFVRNYIRLIIGFFFYMFLICFPFLGSFLPQWYDSRFQHYCNEKKTSSGTEKTLSGPYFGTDGTLETLRDPEFGTESSEKTLKDLKVGTEGTAKTPSDPRVFFITEVQVMDMFMDILSTVIISFGTHNYKRSCLWNIKTTFFWLQISPRILV